MTPSLPGEASPVSVTSTIAPPTSAPIRSRVASGGSNGSEKTACTHTAASSATAASLTEHAEKAQSEAKASPNTGLGDTSHAFIFPRPIILDSFKQDGKLAIPLCRAAGCKAAWAARTASERWREIEQRLKPERPVPGELDEQLSSPTTARVDMTDDIWAWAVVDSALDRCAYRIIAWKPH